MDAGCGCSSLGVPWRERELDLQHTPPFARVRGARAVEPRDTALRLATRAPFHLEATVRVLQRRPANLVDVWEHGRYLRVLTTADGLVLVEVADAGTVDDPDVRLRVLRGHPSGPTTAALGAALRRMLGLDVDPKPLQERAEAERRLRESALALRGMRPPRFAGLFEAFASVVPFQQLSLDAGIAVLCRLVERFGPSLEHDGRRRYAFPGAPVIAEARLDALRACGLSHKKAETLRQVARSIGSGDLTEERLSRMSSGEAIRFLDELPGVGPWTATLVLLRGLGRLDVFPPGDVGVARGLGGLLHLRSPRSLERVVARFGGQRGYLYFCSLGSALLARNLIRAAPPPPHRIA